MRSELLDLGITAGKVEQLLPALAARGVNAVHVHLLGIELGRKKGIDDVGAVAVARLSGEFVAREFLSIPEVVMLAKQPGILELAGQPVRAQPMRFNTGGHKPGVFWEVDGVAREARPDDLRAASIVLVRREP